MADESTTSLDDQEEKEHKVRKPAYLSLDAHVKDIVSHDRDGGEEIHDKGEISGNGEEPEYEERGGGKENEEDIVGDDEKEHDQEERGGSRETNERDVEGNAEVVSEKGDRKDRPGNATIYTKDVNGSEPLESDVKAENEDVPDRSDSEKPEHTGPAVERPDRDDELKKVGQKEKGSGGEKPEKSMGSIEEGAPFDPSKGWHKASRDWMICFLITCTILIIFVILLNRLDVLKHDMVVLFVGVFMIFLIIVALIFFNGNRKVADYQARFFFYKYNPIKFLEFLQYEIIMKYGIGMDKIDPISGHTFGLLIPKGTWKLSTGEILEVNLFKGPLASFVYAVPWGMTLGLYLLVKAPPESPVWPIIEDLIQKKHSWESLKI